VDVTDRESVMAAADRLEGPIAIITEGLMFYLNDYEQKTVCENMAAVLRKHGGCYITPDFISGSYALDFARAIVGEKGAAALLRTTRQYNDAGDSNITDTMQKPIEQIIAMFNEAGLEVRQHPVYTDAMEVRSLSQIDAALLPRLKPILAQGQLICCTLRENAAAAVQTGDSSTFSVTCAGQGDTVSFRLSGRLDSLTSPRFYDCYTAAPNGMEASRIEIDASALEYISSAGLRVLLLMKNKQPDRQVILRGCNETVREVLQQTGFSQMLTLE